MTLSEERDFVFAKKPVFGALYRKYKHKTWLDYAEACYPSTKVGASDLYNTRFGELAAACKSMTVPLYSTQISDRIIDTLQTHRFVSTAEHHGILCNPFFLNSALVRTHYQPELPAIALTCGGVSFSNSSYPRGLTYHDDQLKEMKLPLVPWKYRQCPVYGHGPVSQADLVHTLKLIRSRHHPLLLEQKLTGLIDVFCADSNLFKLASFSDQCSLLTQLLWKQSNLKGSVVYIEIESLVRELLLNYHLHQNTLIHRLLFDRQYRGLYITHFEGMIGAHSDALYGTHLFWHIDHHLRKRVSLFEHTGVDGASCLQSADGTIRIPLTPAAIEKHLADRTLLPCLALCYSMISFYYGITLGGGFSQVQYLADMKRAYTKVILATKDTERDVSMSIRTDIFTGECILAAIRSGRATTAASLLDVYLWGDQSTHDAHSKLLHTLTIGESLDMMMPQLAHIISPSHQLSNSMTNFPASLHVHY